MKSHLVRWHEKYAQKGLVIMDLQQEPLEKLKQAAEEDKLPYFIGHDRGGKVSKAYGVRAYAAAVLVGVDGRVIWNGHPANKVKACEQRIRRELEKVSEETQKTIEKESEESVKKEDKEAEKNEDE